LLASDELMSMNATLGLDMLQLQELARIVTELLLEPVDADEDAIDGLRTLYHALPGVLPGYVNRRFQATGKWAKDYGSGESTIDITVRIKDLDVLYAAMDHANALLKGKL
jgi:hypothetical protein